MQPAVGFAILRSSISKLFSTHLPIASNQQPLLLARTSELAQNITRNISRPTRTMSSSSPVYTVEYLSNKLSKELDAEHVDMEDLSNCGCGMKFDAVIVSPKFEGKPVLQRQRLVNQTLAEEMKYIHAFTMRTLTPSQWKEAQSKKN